MHLIRAFTVMLGDITAADASRRQVRGILTWREQVQNAVFHALEPQGTFIKAVPSSATHRGWRVASAMILDALEIQSQKADEVEAEAKKEEDEERKAAAADVRAAEAAEQAAAAEDAAAARCASGDEDGQAAYHQAAAARCREEAAACRESAARHREAAEAADRRRLDALAWGVLARDARDFGERLVRQENAVAAPVGEALTAAGGLSEVYRDKQALTTDGAR